jgi:cytochrome P450/NADPH-cytochrome P450 reductase
MSSRIRHGPEIVVDVLADFTRLTIDTLALCAMNYRFNSFYLNEDFHPYSESLARISIEVDRQSTYPEELNIFRPKAIAQFERDIQNMTDIAKAIVHERRKNPDESEAKHADLLHHMIHGKDPKTGSRLSEQSIIYNLQNFLIAGHDTTSSTLSFAFYFMLDNPEILRKAREEVDTLVTADEPLSVQHLQQMTYLDMILRETLRLCPSVPALHLKALKDREILGGKYILKESDAICILLQKMHQDPSIWGPNADEFDPERMSQEKLDALPPNSWKAFGNGERACIGRSFAWQESKLVSSISCFHYSGNFSRAILTSCLGHGDDASELRHGERGP